LSRLRVLLLLFYYYFLVGEPNTVLATQALPLSLPCNGPASSRPQSLAVFLIALQALPLCDICVYLHVIAVNIMLLLLLYPAAVTDKHVAATADEIVRIFILSAICSR
jgi:hypothetical protein